MIQIIEQTHDEMVAMYIKSCTKKQLAEMLANANEVLKAQPANIFLNKCPRCGTEYAVNHFCATGPTLSNCDAETGFTRLYVEAT